MPRPNIPDYKDSYLDFVELLKSCRLKSRGKKGPTIIYKTEVEVLGIDRRDLSDFLVMLADDDVIRELSEEDHRRLLSTDEFTVFCLMTAGEIGTYKRSYEETDSGALIPAPSWGSVTMHFPNEVKVFVTVSGGEITNKELTPHDFGLVIKKRGENFGKPNLGWAFLHTLASNSGVFQIPRGTNKRQMDVLKQKKKDVKAALQRVFGPLGDPFYEFSDGQYRLRPTVTVVAQRTPTQPVVAQEHSAFEQTIDDLHYTGDFTDDSERRERYKNQGDQ